jgi:hypothetical protein
MSIEDVFGAISNATQGGADATGSIAQQLIGAGLSLAAITQILQGVANNANASPAMINYAQQELAYAAQNYAQPRFGIGTLLLVAAGVYLLSRE